MNSKDKTIWATIVGLIAAVVAIGAGIYLLDSQSAAAEATVFDSIMHGLGAYMIARGLWMIHGVIR